LPPGQPTFLFLESLYLSNFVEGSFRIEWCKTTEKTFFDIFDKQFWKQRKNWAHFFQSQGLSLSLSLSLSLTHTHTHTHTHTNTLPPPFLSRGHICYSLDTMYEGQRASFAEPRRPEFGEKEEEKKTSNGGCQLLFLPLRNCIQPPGACSKNFLSFPV
jgi:hypothetical protein